MWNGFVGGLIRRTNQRMLITGLLLLAGVAAFFAYNLSYFRGFFGGPHRISVQELTTAQESRSFSNPFVTVTDESTEPTNLEEMRDDHGTQVQDAGFLSAEIGGHHMLVRVAPDAVSGAATPGSLTGQLKNFADIRNSLYGRYTLPADDLLPLYLDTHEYRTFGYVSLLIGVPLLLLALWILARWWQFSSDFSRHPLSRGLAKQGQLELLVQQLDSEMAGAHTVVRRRTQAAHITEHWFVATGPFSGVAMLLPGIVWTYRALVKRRIYFFITVGKRHMLHVFDRTGAKAAVQLSEAQAADAYQHLGAVTPGAVHGYDKRVAALWRKTADKAAFPGAVATLLGGDALPEQRVTSQHGGLA